MIIIILHIFTSRTRDVAVKNLRSLGFNHWFCDQACSFYLGLFGFKPLDGLV